MTMTKFNDVLNRAQSLGSAIADASVAWNLFVANSAALIAAHLEPETARTIFGPANALIFWGPPNETVAIVEPGGYRVSGR